MSESNEILPEKIVQMDQIRINRNLDNNCKCSSIRKFTLDTTNRKAFCLGCGAEVDPYDAMYDMAVSWEKINEDLERVLKQRKEIYNYKPHLLTIRALEKEYRGKKMLPICPRCTEPFYLEELVKWQGRKFADRRIDNWKEQNK